jgi:hypothetical protein
MPFQKGNQHARKGPMRQDTTIELITQLNELTKYSDGSKRTKLHARIAGSGRRVAGNSHSDLVTY